MFPRRPCLVLEAFHHPSTQIRLSIAPVTKLSDTELDDTDLTIKQKELFIPLYPNVTDQLCRDSVRTIPVWPRDNAYVMLQGLHVSVDRVQEGERVTFVCAEDDFQRIKLLMDERRHSHFSPAIINPNIISRSRLNPSARPFTPSTALSPTASSVLNPRAPDFCPSPSPAITFFDRFTPPHPPQIYSVPGLTHFPRFTPLPQGSQSHSTPIHGRYDANQSNIVVDLNSDTQDIYDITQGSLADDVLLVQEIVGLMVDDSARGGHALADILE